MNQSTVSHPSRWRAHVVRVGAGIAVVAVVAGGGAAAYAAHCNAPDEYRTARAALGDVSQVLAVSGTVDPSGRSDLSFGTSGTVAKLAVGVGDKVTRGQILATLDTTSLKAAVTQANAELAAARAQLANDEDAQASTVSSASTTSSTASTTTATVKAPTSGTPTSTDKGSGSTGAGSTGASSTATSKALAQLATQQRAVEVAEKAVDTAIAASQEALKQEQSLCAADSTSAASSAPSASASAATDTSGTDACQAAIEAVQVAQQAVADAEYSGSGNLKDALAALATTLSDAAKAAAAPAATGSASSSSSAKGGQQTGSSKSTPSTDAATSSTGSSTSLGSSQSAASGSTSTPSGMGGGQTVTAVTLAKDQASIDSARATLIKASQALSGATIKAPSSGTVAQVSVTKGGTASAGSSAVVVIAPGTTTVELSVSSAQVAELKVGQKAQVTPAGADQAYAGTVTRINRIPTTSASGSSTYPVTVTLDERKLSLLAGSTAAVDVTLGSAGDVLTVPTSAVSNGAVQVYADGKVSWVRVTTGLVGRARTVITDGLEAGQEVVLADLSTDLPTGDAQSGTPRGLSTSRSGGSPGGGPVVGFGS